MSVVVEVGEAIDGDGRGRARFGAGGNHGVVRWSCGLLKLAEGCCHGG